MPRVNIERGTNFIIEDEHWQLVEYDHTSVAGVIYLSVTENKVNMIYDDLNEDIADTDRLAQYRIDLPPVD
jgi:predicted AlkP superfamily pyrophosphatase or phosphodiesterase